MILALLLLGAAGFLHTFDPKNETPIVKPLAGLPDEIGRWKAGSDLQISDRELSMLGMDDYVFRDYHRENAGINFYVSYYGAIHRDKGYHSPLNCMPGSGWGIAETSRISLELPDGTLVRVRLMVLERGSQQQYSLYWYQCRSRIIATEYRDLAFRLLDSIRYGRTDGAFVRLIISGTEDSATAMEQLKDFASQAIPILEEYLPGG